MKPKKPLLKRWIFWIPVSLYLILGMLPLFLKPEFTKPLPASARWHTMDVQTVTGIHTLRYAKGGTEGGERVIFVHGTPGDAGGWSDFMTMIPNGMEFIAVDRLGFSGSAASGAQTSLQVQAESLKPLLGEGALLVGHSLGGPIVAKAALLYPDQVKGISILAGSLDPSLEEINPLQYIAFLPPFRWTLDAALYVSNLELFALEAELIALSGDLPALRVPTEIIHGTKDSLVPYANVPFMMREMRGITPNLITLTDVDHFLPWTQQGEILESILRLRARARGAGHPNLASQDH